MRIGIFVGSGTAVRTIDSVVQQVVDAERDGFDSFWFAQTFGPDVLTVISLAGRVTKTIELGTAVVPTFPRHPLVLAQQAMTTQAATGGRLALGIGLSHKVIIERRLGLSFDRPARHMLEYLSVLRALVNEGGVDFEGQTLRVSAKLDLLPAKPCPILVAALGPRMLRIAGELADGTITWMAARKTVATHIVPRISSVALAAGRPAPRICVGVPIAVTDDPEPVREKLAKDLRGYGRLPSYRRLLDIEGVEDPAQVAIVGNEADVERQLRDLAAVGATDLLAMLYPLGEDNATLRERGRKLLKGLLGKV